MMIPSSIKVYPGGKLEIIFGGGYLVEESV